MNRLSIEKRAQILQLLCEGMSIRATCRATGASKNTVAKLLADVGNACLDYQDEHLVDLACKRVQCDEIWSFCYAKAKNVPKEMRGEFGVGDVWTWVALDADTKLVPCWSVGDRGSDTARDFMLNLAGRVQGRFQLTTDGHGAYLPAVEAAFGGEVDY
nr:helix-turn-helix domain-containing protein [bacterium]